MTGCPKASANYGREDGILTRAQLPLNVLLIGDL
jgi:hypothetical protein